MNIVAYSSGADTGGQCYRLHQAFANHSPHSVRSLVRSTNYIHYPQDLTWHYRDRALAIADVVHAKNTLRSLEGFPRGLVVQYHGSGFRGRPEAYIAAQKQWGATGLVSTLDLWLLAPDDTEWMPSPYDLDQLAAYRQPRHDGVFRVGHAPTNRAIKSTAALIEAVGRLNKVTPTELVLIERRPWAQCLRLKGTVDVLFDQVLLGYGNNAIEAWGMGIPVVAGGQPDTLAVMRDRFGGLPFYEADEGSIYDALAEFTDEVARKEWGERGYAHAERWHSERAVVEMLTPVYEAAARAETPTSRPQRQQPRRPRRGHRTR